MALFTAAELDWTERSCSLDLFIDVKTFLRFFVFLSRFLRFKTFFKNILTFLIKKRYYKYNSRQYSNDIWHRLLRYIKHIGNATE